MMKIRRNRRERLQFPKRAFVFSLEYSLFISFSFVPLVLTFFPQFSFGSVERRKITPFWSNASKLYSLPNLSYMENTQIGRNTSYSFGSKTVFSTNDPYELLNESEVTSIRENYLNQVNRFEFKKNYGLSDERDEKEYKQNLDNISKDIEGRILAKQGPKYEEKFKAMARKDPRMRVPAAMVGAITTFYLGRPIRRKLTDHAAITARIKAIDPSGQIQFNSGNFTLENPIALATLDLQMKAPSEWGRPITLPENSSSVSLPGERYTVNVSRAIPVLEMQTGLSYGGTSQSLRASMSKEVLKNTTVFIESSRWIRNFTERSKIFEDSLRLSYAIQF